MIKRGESELKIKYFLLVFFLFFLSNIYAANYTEGVLTDDNFTLFSTPADVNRLFGYNDTWLNFDGVNDILFLPSVVRGLVRFEWNGTGSWITQEGIAIANTYPIYHNGTGYIAGKKNSTTFYSGGVDEINIYDYNFNSSHYFSFDGVNDYMQRTATTGLSLNDSITLGGWYQPIGNLTFDYSSLIRVNNGEYQLFSGDDNFSRAFFGDGSGWVATHSGLLASNPQRWQFFMASYDNETNNVSFYSNSYSRRIYSIGDSITAGHPTHCTQVDNCAFSRGTNLNASYQYWLDYYMGSFASAESYYKTYYNKGHGSETCDNIIARWNNEVDGLVNNTQVVIMCGINDGMANSTEVKQDYDQIVALAQARNQTLYWGEVLPTTTSGCTNVTYVANMTDVNNYIQSLADTYDFIEIIHWHNNLTNGTYGCANSSYFADTVHPNSVGQQKLAQQLWYEIFDGVDYTQTLQLQEVGNTTTNWDGIENVSSINVTLGARESGVDYLYKGYMQNVMIFNYSLNSSEVNSIFTSGQITKFSNSYLVSNWGLNHTFRDIVGSNDLTNSGATFVPNENQTIAFFNFDGNLYDTAGNYTSATIQGTGNTSSQGKYNQGLSLNGSNSYINLTGMDSSLQLIGKNFTISSWIRLNNYTSTIANFIFGNNFTAGGYGFSVVENHLQFWVSSPGGAAESLDNFTLNTWHHVVVTSNQSGLYDFYIDGEYAGTDNSSLISGGGNNYLIGADPRDGTPYFINGSIDNLLVENYKRNSTEILDLYDDGLFSLKERLKLNENNGTIAYNVQNVSNNATISGATWVNDNIEINLTEDVNFSLSGAVLTLLQDNWDWNWFNISYYIDDVSPTTIINSPDNTTYSTSSIIFNITATDVYNISSCIYSLDGSSNVSLTNSAGNYWTKTSSVAEGNHNVTFYCADSAGNLDDSSEYFRIVLPEEESSGGSGGAAIPTTNVTTFAEKTTSIIWNNVPENEEIGSNISVAGINLTRVSVQTIQNVTKISVTIKTVNPTSNLFSGFVVENIYQGFQINKTGVTDGNIEEVSFEFKIGKSWLDERNISSVVLQRKADNSSEWKMLNTTLINEDSTYYYLKSTSPGFSIFAIYFDDTLCIPRELFCLEDILMLCGENRDSTIVENCEFGCSEGKCVVQEEAVSLSSDNFFRDNFVVIIFFVVVAIISLALIVVTFVLFKHVKKIVKK